MAAVALSAAFIGSTMALAPLAQASDSGAKAPTPATSTAGSARVSPATAGGYCGIYGNGYTNETFWNKAAPGCQDFNLTYTASSGYFRGAYETSSGAWNWCSKIVYHTGGQNYLQVLCSNVATGTPLTVLHVDSSGAQTSNQGYNVHVNY
jgi:hypothetical protein